jgi:sugar lactone lactonase YvrE
MQAQLLSNTQCRLGEGPVWYEGALYWIDIESKRVYRGNVMTTAAEVLVDLPSRVGFISPRKTGGWALGLEDGLYAINKDWSMASLRLLAPIEADRPDLRLNDGKPDLAGRLWCGSLSLNGSKEQASLYRIDKTLNVHQMLNKVNLSNGLAWSSNGRTMYYIDTPLRRVEAFNFDESEGSISNRRTVYALAAHEGYPDGMAIDSVGRLWVACWGGSAVLCVDPARGDVVDRIDLPCPNVTSCCFGGDALDMLYITTARDGMDAELLRQSQQAGSVFVARPTGVHGAAVAEFDG